MAIDQVPDIQGAENEASEVQPGRSQGIDGVEMRLVGLPLVVLLYNRQNSWLSANRIGRDAPRKIQKTALFVVVLVEALAGLLHAKCCFV